MRNGADAYHGVGGPLAVSNMRPRHKLSEAYLQACINIGMRRMADINTPPQEGVGYVPVTQRKGWGAALPAPICGRQRVGRT